MRKFGKIVLILLLVIVAGAGAGVAYLFTAFPKVKPAPEVKIESTPELVARGKYLANHVALCVDCHSERDWSKFAAPMLSGTEGKGGERFPEEMGFPGTFYAKNITPAALSSWTDGEIFRAITSGVSKDGTPLFPVMPYPNYAKMDPEDINAIIAYIRTIQPIEHAVPASEPSFPFNLIMRTIPADATLGKRPEKSDVVEYGKYMFTFAGCQDCHTPVDKGQLIMDQFLAGGREFPTPDGKILRSANITPDKKTGIGMWDKETFISKFKYYADSAQQNKTVEPGGFNTIMPWSMYAGMTEEDLGAMYDYIMTVKPIENQVERYAAKQ